ncbi:MAG TPA: hypothetical protein VFS67_13805 [Polyangiaceae bacterium]|nr:hypothetical protein [Polyangiaceae bacterium]
MNGSEPCGGPFHALPQLRRQGFGTGYSGGEIFGHAGQSVPPFDARSSCVVGLLEGVGGRQGEPCNSG